MSRAVSAALGALTALALVLFPTGISQAQENEYVALGDSYSSGSGAGDYTDTACTRSANSYPARWAAANSPRTFTFVACGGATIPDVQAGQLSALSAATTLVSISIGGNDSGFASTMLRCKLLTTSGCRRALEEARAYVDNQLPGALATLYSQIRSRAPQAKVVVVGYPYLYKVGGLCLGDLNADKRALLKDGSDALNAVIATAARNAGFAFADGRPAFAGHEICTTDEWIDPTTIHPNATGHQRGYLPAFTAAASS
ncbi:SGNH/GDSL hydrolase family protein [Thermomonospora echinospora]|nr:SGNH/GDSL hydrolase family protein [Thermomonospora echinospora]